MALVAGTRLGPYEVQSALGAGGMGEVYRARDTRLKRDVALKILPASFASDPERLARFQREAEVLASLNHPNIGGIHGLEDAGGVTALVLELVDGPTLADRIQGPIPLDETWPIAKQIAEALEAAHEQGIIHRDLKPANVKVRDDGTVKVLDFGLAKLTQAGGTGKAGEMAVAAALSQSPTITSPALMTGAGVLLGTAAYMSPEQAKGREADKRSDIWAFGCVLYEMLAGQRAFPGDDLSETLAAVIKSEPDWAALPATIPAPARRLLARCLQKERRRRLADIADARLELEDASNRHADDVASPPAGRRLRRERIAWAACVLLLGLVSAFALVVGFRSPPGQPELRVDITFPPNTEPASPTISPDGRQIAFVARTDRRSRVWIHTLDGRPARPLDRTDGAQDRLFWSPDSRSVGFFAEGKLKRVDFESGAVQTLADVVATFSAPAGGAWNRDGVILFAPTRGPLFRVPQTGGEVAAVTRVEAPHIRHVQPQFLPDGRHFLFFSFGDSDLRGVYVGDLEGATAPQRLLVDVDGAVYAASGHLFFARQGALLAQRFDADAMRLVGAPRQVTESIRSRLGVMTFSASETGSLVYVSRDVEEIQRRLIWFDRSGKELQQLDGRDPVETDTVAALSPEGRRLAVDRRGSIWILDAERGGLTRFGTPGENFPLWAPQGDRLVFQSQIDRGVNSLSQRALTGGEAELLLATAGPSVPNDWSPDGRLLLYRDSSPQTGFDLWLLPVERETSSGRLRPATGQGAKPFTNTAAGEMNGQFSPDGAAIAYESDESGEWEIYLQPFGRPGAREQVSVAGGRYARWRRDGRELYYHAADGRLMMVPIRPSSTDGPRRSGDPMPLFSVPLAPGSGQRPQFVVTNDGERFLVNTVTGTAPVDVTMIMNWRATR